MKYIVILGDGMADEPIDALGGKSPLACAETPVMDELASKGEMGMVQNGPRPGWLPAATWPTCPFWGIILLSVTPDDLLWKH